MRNADHHIFTLARQAPREPRPVGIGPVSLKCIASLQVRRAAPQPALGPPPARAARSLSLAFVHAFEYVLAGAGRTAKSDFCLHVVGGGPWLDTTATQSNRMQRSVAGSTRSAGAAGLFFSIPNALWLPSDSAFASLDHRSFLPPAPAHRPRSPYGIMLGSPEGHPDTMSTLDKQAACEGCRRSKVSLAAERPARQALPVPYPRTVGRSDHDRPRPRPCRTSVRLPPHATHPPPISPHTHAQVKCLRDGPSCARCRRLKQPCIQRFTSTTFVVRDENGAPVATAPPQQQPRNSNTGGRSHYSSSSTSTTTTAASTPASPPSLKGSGPLPPSGPAAAGGAKRLRKEDGLLRASAAEEMQRLLTVVRLSKRAGIGWSRGVPCMLDA